MNGNTVLITGVDGFLGGKITRRILENTDLNVLGLTMSMEWAQNMCAREGIGPTDRLAFVLNDDFLDGDRGDWPLFGAIHLAFSRRMQPAADIASSIMFAAKVFHRLADLGTDRVIYMSSQGVYGNTDQIRTELTPPAPATQYTMAKYAAEVLFHDILRDARHHTALRLDPVAQSQNVIKGLCKSAASASPAESRCSPSSTPRTPPKRWSPCCWPTGSGRRSTTSAGTESALRWSSWRS